MPKGKNRPLPQAPADSKPAEQAGIQMVFHAQLAHGSGTKQIKDFTNVKGLYAAIAKAHGIKVDDILYCTLNTHKADMARLLGGQIGLDDFIFAHCRGDSKTVKVNKSGPALGLTISDNGAGFAFIKKVRGDSVMAGALSAGGTDGVGAHIAGINGKTTVGSRHFEVARILKEIPIGSEFSLDLVLPKKSFEAINPRGSVGGTGEVASNAGKKTLRMKKDGTATVETAAAGEDEKMISKIDDLMENYIGIRDEELSTSVYYMAKAAKEADEFAGALDDQLGDFEFPDDFVLDVFEMIN
jgi:hypothetical protein